jgi:hypothetical protein
MRSTKCSANSISLRAKKINLTPVRTIHPGGLRTGERRGNDNEIVIYTKV